MRVTQESPWKIGLALTLVVVAALMVLRMFLASGAPPSPSPAATAVASEAQRVPAQRAAIRARRGGRPAPAVAAPSLDPTLRLDLLRASEATVYEGTGRNIFRAQEEPAVAQIPQPVSSPRGDPEPVGDPGPPPPPPIPLKFFGFASRAGEPQQVFLSEGEDVYIAKEGDIVGRRYRVVRIGTNSVEIEDVLSNRRQTIPLTQS